HGGRPTGPGEVFDDLGGLSQAQPGTAGVSAREQAEDARSPERVERLPGEGRVAVDVGRVWRHDVVNDGRQRVRVLHALLLGIVRSTRPTGREGRLVLSDAPCGSPPLSASLSLSQPLSAWAGLGPPAPRPLRGSRPIAGRYRPTWPVR